MDLFCRQSTLEVPVQRMSLNPILCYVMLYVKHSRKSQFRIPEQKAWNSWPIYILRQKWKKTENLCLNTILRVKLSTGDFGNQSTNSDYNYYASKHHTMSRLARTHPCNLVAAQREQNKGERQSCAMLQHFQVNTQNFCPKASHNALGIVHLLRNS